MRRVVPLLLLVLLALLAGCGEKTDVLEPSGSKHVTLMLDYFPNADHAGIYAAQAAGDFKQAGLDVEIRQPAATCLIGAAGSTWRSPTSPKCSGRATRA